MQRLHKRLAREIDEYTTYPIAVIDPSGTEVHGILVSVDNELVTIRHKDGIKEYDIEGEYDFRPITKKV